MEEHLENIDFIFRDELKEYSPEVPHGMWEKIALNLPAGKKPTFLPLLWKIAASVALIIVTGSVATYFISSNQKSENIAQKDIIIPKDKVEIRTQPQTSNLQAPTATYQSKAKSAIKSVEPANQKEQLNIAENPQINQIIANDIPDQKYDSTEVQDFTAENRNYTAENLNSNIPAPNSVVSIENMPEKENIKPELASNELVFDDYEKEKVNVKWLIGGQVGPQYTYRNLTSEYQSDMIDEINSNEVGVVAYAGGVNIEVQPNRRFSIQSGIYYSKIGMEQAAIEVQNTNNNAFSHNTDDYGAKSQNTADRYRFPNSSVTFEQKSNSSPVSTIKQPTSVIGVPSVESENSVVPDVFTRYQDYIEVPLVAKFMLVDRKFGLNVLGGLSSNFLVNNYNVSDNSVLENDYITENVNAINLSSTLGLGLNYDISSRINLSVEPQFKYYLTKQINTDNYNIHPYTIGVFTGVKYLF